MRELVQQSKSNLTMRPMQLCTVKARLNTFYISNVKWEQWLLSEYKTAFKYYFLFYSVYPTFEENLLIRNDKET